MLLCHNNRPGEEINFFSLFLSQLSNAIVVFFLSSKLPYGHGRFVVMLLTRDLSHPLLFVSVWLRVSTRIVYLFFFTFSSSLITQQKNASFLASFFLNAFSYLLLHISVTALWFV